MSGVSSSRGVSSSDGVSWSDGVSSSRGVSSSDGVSWSDGVNNSYGVNKSYGVNRSYGVSSSRGVSSSDGVSSSYGVINSFGVDHALFCADKPRSYTIFGVEVSRERFVQISDTLYSKLGGWYPKFNNAYDLWVSHSKDWTKVDAQKIVSTLGDSEKPYEAWKDMPQEAIDYLMTLEEFDATIFKRVTGIDVKTRSVDMIEIKETLMDLVDLIEEVFRDTAKGVK